MNIFPEDIEDFNEIIEETVKQNELPIFREYDVNLETGEMIYENGKNKIVEGNEALKIWIHYALKTTRSKYTIYSDKYGNEFEKIIGSEYSKELRDTEIERYLIECLTVNPYIKSVDDIKINFNESKLTINCKVNTIYGEVEISNEQ